MVTKLPFNHQILVGGMVRLSFECNGYIGSMP
jgi:hypothetical protein